MTVPLKSEIKTYAAQVFVSPTNQKILKRCISRYSTPRSFSQTLYYIAYRVLNAVKSIFKKSDWQLAEKALIHGVNTNQNMQAIFFFYPKSHSDKAAGLLKSTIEKGKIPMAKIVLTGLIQINEGTATPKQIEKKILRAVEQWDKKFQVKLNELVDQLPPRYSALKNIKIEESWWYTST